MRLLVLYRQQEWRPQRKAIQDHLDCFGKFSPPGIQVDYCNVLTGLPFYLRWVQFDGIILHTTLIDRDVRLPANWKHLLSQLQDMRHFDAVKVALPQDEWENTQTLWQLFRQTGVQSVFSCATPVSQRVLYPPQDSGIRHMRMTLPGFVDDAFVAKAASLACEVPERDLDIGYRARHMGFLCGRLGEVKHALTERFQAYQGYRNLRMDISNKHVFYGDDWIRFLLRCRVVLGCPGGSSLLDLDGSIRQRVERYIEGHPQASFDEVEAHCFPGLEGNFCLSAISPRHFECAATKTCQLLIEGDYSGDEILKPGVHYIQLKRDFSNIEDVLDEVADKDHCRSIAERCYQDLVVSRKYTYEQFVREMVDHIQSLRKTSISTRSGRMGLVAQLLKWRRRNTLWSKLRWKLWYLRHVSLPKRWR